jgi:DNA-binding MarR family transcriptional regulator
MNVDPTDAASTLRRGTTRLGRRLRLERPEHSVSLQQLNTLALLHQHGPSTAGELAARQRLQPQSLSRTLTALECDGLVTRSADPADRRRALLVITDGGLGALRHDISQRDAWLAAAMADSLTPAEQQLLRIAGELMERLAEAPMAALRAPLSGAADPGPGGSTCAAQEAG